jgi:UDP-2,3-diacylglucosamine hydrolase
MAARFHYTISDLHLSANEPELTALFFSFLSTHTPHMQSLDILGDFFDAWIGDDDDSSFVTEIAGHLRAIANKIPVRFAHGNRDFLLGSIFAARTEMQLLHEVTAEHGWVICHGDHLCTDDLSYMQFRQQVRNQAWQKAFLSKSLEARRAFAADARAQSSAHQKNTSMDIVDVNADALNALMQSYPDHMLLHGHTHRPGVFQHEFGTRVVLGDWRKDQPSYLKRVDRQFELAAHGQIWQGHLP